MEMSKGDQNTSQTLPLEVLAYKSEAMRCSIALIKKYRIDDPKGEIQKETTYLCEEMFGYAPFGKNGFQLDIIWVDDPNVRTGIQDPQPRIKFHKKNSELDEKKWRFTKQEWPA